MEVGQLVATRTTPPPKLGEKEQAVIHREKVAESTRTQVSNRTTKDGVGPKF